MRQILFGVYTEITSMQNIFALLTWVLDLNEKLVGVMIPINLSSHRMSKEVRLVHRKKYENRK